MLQKIVILTLHIEAIIISVGRLGSKIADQDLDKLPRRKQRGIRPEEIKARPATFVTGLAS